jgi:predicted nuclease with RNAse H fold
MDTPRPSCVASLDGTGRLCRVEFAVGDDDLLAAIPDGVCVAAIDAPLVVANTVGQRAAEHLLAWLDAVAFPNSTDRLERLYGGLRGVILRDALITRAERVVETLPDLVLRELLWEQSHPASDDALELAEYRSEWLGVRPPRYRPKGRGRATAAGLAAAAAILEAAMDLGDWTLIPDPDDWQAIADAACLDAVACAYTAWRLATAPGRTLLMGDLQTPLAIPADANLRARAELHRARLGAAHRPSGPG